MEKIVTGYMSALELGKPVAHRNLTVVPLLSRNGDFLGHITLDEAYAARTIVIKEVEGGHVPELRVINNGGLAVLILDGEEIKGARQNRTLNTSVLVAANSMTVLPVSCTEQGRWGMPEEAAPSGNLQPSGMRGMVKPCVTARAAEGLGFQSDQGEVWQFVNMTLDAVGIQSPTSAMSDAYRRMDEDLAKILKSIPVEPDQVGLAAVISGRFAGFDVIPCRDAYKVLHTKLIRSYGMDALIGRHDVVEPADVVAEVKRWLDASLACTESRFKSVGEGDDYRYTGSGINGSALVAYDKLVHAAFLRSNGGNTGQGEMLGWRVRSSNRQGRGNRVY